MCRHTLLPAGRLPLRSCLAAAALAGIVWLAGPSACGQELLKIACDQSMVTVAAGDQAVLKYQYMPNPRKPYAKEWFSPGGAGVLRDAPADHLHHHGLMFAVAVEGVDFWSENEKCGRQKHIGIEGARAFTRNGVPWCRFTQVIDWVGPDGHSLLLRERRQIEVCRLGEPAATLLVWSTSLAVPPGKASATLSGSPYFGLGARFVKSMDAGGRFVSADAGTGVEGTNAARSAWCAYSAAAEGQPVTVAMFDCPKNPRHPATWFTMNTPFAYLAATLNLNKEPLVIEAGKPLELRYAAAVWDGQVESEVIRKLYEQLPRLLEEPNRP